MPETKREFLVHHNYDKSDGVPRGHFFIELREYKSDGGYRSEFYGKVPAKKGHAWSDGKIKDEIARYQDRGKEKVFSKLVSGRALSLSEAEYSSVLKFAKDATKNPGKYRVLTDNCILFVNQAYKATGREGDFTYVYTKKQLLGMGSAASLAAIARYKAGDEKILVRGSREDLAKLHRVSIDSVKELTTEDRIEFQVFDAFLSHYIIVPLKDATSVHTVQKGESLWKIARDHDLRISELLNVPGNEEFKDDYEKIGKTTIRPGQTFNLPANVQRPQTESENFFANVANAASETVVTATSETLDVQAKINERFAKEHAEQMQKGVDAAVKFGEKVWHETVDVSHKAAAKVGAIVKEAGATHLKTTVQLGEMRAEQVGRQADTVIKFGEKVWHETVDASKRAAAAIETKAREHSKATHEYLEKATGAVKRAISEISAGAAEVGQMMAEHSTPAADSLLKILTGDFTSDHKKDMGATYRDGLADHGPNHEVFLPPQVLNGDGLKNVAPSSIVTDAYRPGAGEKSRVNFKKDMSRMTTPPSPPPPQRSFVETTVRDAEHLLLRTVNTVKRWTSTYLNIDPIVINLNGKGIRFISLDDSDVLFDMDNDGFIENTGWISRGSAFLAVDKNGNGIVDDITEMVSEYYFTAPRVNTSAVVKANSPKSARQNIKRHPFEVLDWLDADRNYVIDENDKIFQSLILWHDMNEDGFCVPHEMHPLSKYGIASIDLRYVAAKIEGSSQIKYTSKSTTVDGKTLETYAVVFDFKAEGDMFQSHKLGKITRSETGFASLKLAAPLGFPMFLSEYGVQNLYGSDGDDDVRGDDGDNWVFEPFGNNKIDTGAGNDVIAISAENDPNLVKAGTGYDILFAIGEKGITFIMYLAGIEQVFGTKFADFIAVGNLNGATMSGFIDGGEGDDLLIGDDASDAISGGDGDDHIKGMGDNDLLRGDRGNDILEGGEGDDVLEGGQDEDVLLGGEGDDTLKGGQGDDKLYGGDGKDYAKFSGRFEEYKIEKIDDRTYVVRDLHPNRDGRDDLFDIEKVSFSNLIMTLKELFHSYEDFIPLAKDGPTIINPQVLLANDLNFSGKEIYICEVTDAQGGELTVTKENDKTIQMTFTPEAQSFQTKQFGYTICTSDAKDIIETINTKESATARTRVCLTESIHPSDPLFYKQWYLNYANVIQAWEHYSGKGIEVLVNEGDADYTHGDLRANLKWHDIKSEEDFNVHATQVGGVIGAARNDFGLVGIAYSSTLGSDGGVREEHKKYDVINRSWRWSGETGFSPRNRTEKSDEFFAKQGRRGLGTNIVQSAGNERKSGDNTNNYEQTNSEYSIVVGAIYKDVSLSYAETRAEAFSNRGASVLVSAPGSHILTSSTFTINDNGNIFTWDYDTVKGTSFSAPITSGVVALMLEANPYLGYRDVQKILASTARIVDAVSPDWNTNADRTWNFRGRYYSHDYGFGCIDAYVALKAAEFWPYLSTHANRRKAEAKAKVQMHQKIDSGESFSGEILVNDELAVQDVTFGYEINHKNFENVTVELFSPSGTRSILKENGGKNATNLTVKFRALSKHFLGEKSKGTWRYSIRNNHNIRDGFLEAASLSLSGDSVQQNFYMITSELGRIANAVAFNAEADKDAMLFMPSLSENLFIDLTPGKIFRISDVDFASSEAGPNKIVAGTGNDEIVGNDHCNVLYGNDGADKLSGGRGSDLLVGNRGSDILTGGPEADVFVVHYEAGVLDKVTDFSAEDFVVFVGFEGQMDEVKISHSTQGTSFSFSNSQVVEFANYDLSLSMSNVIFVNDFNCHSMFIGDVNGGHHQIETNVNQLVIGISGGNVFHGGSGRDLIVGGNGNNILIGGGGDDDLRGGAGDDNIFGYDGNDKISGGLGKNHLSGGDGRDTFVFNHVGRKNSNFTDVIYDFNMAEDKLDFSTAQFNFDMLKRNHMQVDECPIEYENKALTPCTFIEDANWQVILVGVELSKVVAHAFIL